MQNPPFPRWKMGSTERRQAGTAAGAAQSSMTILSLVIEASRHCFHLIQQPQSRCHFTSYLPGDPDIFVQNIQFASVVWPDMATGEIDICLDQAFDAAGLTCCRCPPKLCQCGRIAEAARHDLRQLGRGQPG